MSAPVNTHSSNQNTTYFYWGTSRYTLTLYNVDASGAQTLVPLSGVNLQKVLDVTKRFFEQLESQAQAAHIVSFTPQQVDRADLDLGEDPAGNITSTNVKFWGAKATTPTPLPATMMTPLAGIAKELQQALILCKRTPERNVPLNAQSGLAAIVTQVKLLGIYLGSLGADPTPKAIRELVSKELCDKTDDYKENEQLLKQIISALKAANREKLLTSAQLEELTPLVKTTDNKSLLDEGVSANYADFNKEGLMKWYGNYIKAETAPFDPACFAILSEETGVQILLVRKDLRDSTLSYRMAKHYLAGKALDPANCLMIEIDLEKRRYASFDKRADHLDSILLKHDHAVFKKFCDRIRLLVERDDLLSEFRELKTSHPLLFAGFCHHVYLCEKDAAALGTMDLHWAEHWLEADTARLKAYALYPHSVLRKFCLRVDASTDLAALRKAFKELKTFQPELFGKICGHIYTEELALDASVDRTHPEWAERWIDANPLRLKYHDIPDFDVMKAL